MRYREDVKAKAVRDFVAANQRAPTLDELEGLIDDVLLRYPAVHEGGFSGIDIVKPKWHGVNGADTENQVREAIYADLIALVRDSDLLVERLETHHRTFLASTAKLTRMLVTEENRLNNLLLSRTAVDKFTYTVEETFTDHQMIVQDETTCQLESGWCTGNRDSYTVLDSSKWSCAASVVTDKGVLGVQYRGSAKSLQESDGRAWEAEVTTQYRMGRVSLLLDIELDELQYVGELRLETRIPTMNSKVVIGVQYTVNGQQWASVEPILTTLHTGEHVIHVGLEAKALRVTVTKEKADYLHQPQLNQYTWLFGVDCLRIYADAFEVDDVQVVAGPYEIVDELAAPVYWSKAKLLCCGVFPPQTSAEFWLSQDGENWLWAGDNLVNPIVSVGDSNMADSYLILDATLDENAVVAAVGLNARATDEVLANRYVNPADAALIAQRSLRVRRNLWQSDVKVRTEDAGWELHDRVMETTVELEADKQIDLGSAGILVDGRLCVGVVSLPQGIHVFGVPQASYMVIDQEPATLDQLMRLDPLYPFNPKYLIEGFRYPAGFLGERVYVGLGDIYGIELQYLPPEMFRLNGKLNHYTFETVDGNQYFKFKTNKSIADWANEQISVEWTVMGGSIEEPHNQLWWKAVLKNNSSTGTPKLDSVQIRVI